MRVFGMQRSGNHAVLSWILGQHDGASLFINNVKLSYALRASRHDARELRAPRRGLAPPLLLLSHEGIDLATQAPQATRYDQRARTPQRVVIVRNPYNLFASRFRLHERRGWQRSYGEGGVPMWVGYAQAALGETQPLPGATFVLYDRWVSEEHYRAQIAEVLGLTFTDAGRDQVADYGGGSSFDRLSFDGSASRMDVLRRWEHFRDEPLLRRLADNPEVRRLSGALFGETVAFSRWADGHDPPVD